ncbi:hypothetical protein FRC15_005950 [Serendipita sp. 397]|nr:hypothetical protein FRC15_005950 [Serendipita sp. 397]KAG8773245.1 hypothetical protein FRC16_005437 [Serendipita sp. 398]
MPALVQNTTAGTTDEAENHMVRAVDTGLINLSLVIQESEEKLIRVKEAQEQESMEI